MMTLARVTLAAVLAIALLLLAFGCTGDVLGPWPEDCGTEEGPVCYPRPGGAR